MEIQSSALVTNQATNTVRAQAPARELNEERKVANDAVIERKELERSERKQADRQREAQQEARRAADETRGQRLDVTV